MGKLLPPRKRGLCSDSRLVEFDLVLVEFSDLDLQFCRLAFPKFNRSSPLLLENKHGLLRRLQLGLGLGHLLGLEVSCFAGDASTCLCLGLDDFSLLASEFNFLLLLSDLEVDEALLDGPHVLHVL